MNSATIKCKSGRAVWAMVVLWMLAAQAVFANDFEFVVIGDTRPRFESESFRPFERLIRRINDLQPALVINLGDLIYGYGPSRKDKQWEKYEKVIKAIQAPYFQAPGNHDTHSKDARKVYGRRFGKFYQSFDYGDCHFVLLDNTEDEKWGYLGQAQLAWLQNDLSATDAHMVFVFLHFPVWEPERIKPEYYEFWSQTLHPLFKASRVKAVFGGHYHTYGPTREFDGIRYFITGGGGAELRPDYRKSGGEYHFMKVTLSGDTFDVRVVTEHGELTDPDADVMGGIQFAARNVSRIGIRTDRQDFTAGVNFNVSVANPYAEVLTGDAIWLLDASRFAVGPERIGIQIPARATRQYSFKLQCLEPTMILESLPRLQFNVVSGGKQHRFHREVRLLQATTTPYRLVAPSLDGDLSDWQAGPAVRLGAGSQSEAELCSCYDRENLYLALTIPTLDPAEAEELGFTDELQIGMARPLTDSDFGGDLLRLGFRAETREVWDRTPGHKTATAIPGMKSISRISEERTTYEIELPLRLLKGLNARSGSRLMLDVSFPMPEPGPLMNEPSEPQPNTLAYRIRFGSDSLVPVYFVELDLERRK